MQIQGMIRQNKGNGIQYPKKVLQILEEIRNKSVPQSLKELEALSDSQVKALEQRLKESIKLMQQCIPISIYQDIFQGQSYKKNKRTYYQGHDQEIFNYEKQLYKGSQYIQDSFYYDQKQVMRKMSLEIKEYTKKLLCRFDIKLINQYGD